MIKGQECGFNYRVVLQWTPLLKTYCIMSETNAVSTLFLSGFFWAFLAGGPVRQYT